MKCVKLIRDDLNRWLELQELIRNVGDVLASTAKSTPSLVRVTSERGYPVSKKCSHIRGVIGEGWWAIKSSSLSDCLIGSMTVNEEIGKDLDDVCCLLQTALVGKSMLILLDDVWEQDIVDRFTKLYDNDCRYLVTTRDEAIYEIAEAEKVEITKDDIKEISKEILLYHSLLSVGELPAAAAVACHASRASLSGLFLPRLPLLHLEAMRRLPARVLKMMGMRTSGRVAFPLNLLQKGRNLHRDLQKTDC
ncbi:hypothetical protein PR202_ga06850 [Eleusine coracana subsp. coracana]|uniref:NB-ARC domain-containing protein n=1 Tax=Eleusine coracana subsp. coracana TaxID=191504 RepID=A0AAV5BXT7_ELECO|nr:hypothetical protein PR202_ga06850 [Eleusine coracana subsp. coracana]